MCKAMHRFLEEKNRGNFNKISLMIKGMAINSYSGYIGWNKRVI